jgi:hypothetical protein
MPQKKKTSIDWTWFDKSDIQRSLSVCERLLGYGLVSGVYPREIEQATLTFFLINLNDLLQKMDSVGHRLEFSDDIHEVCNAKDVTDLINNTRNAGCHLNSGNHLLNTNKITFCIVRGYFPTAFLIKGVVLGSDFADDTAVIFGSNRVYLRRHIRRAFEAAKAFFKVAEMGY